MLVEHPENKTLEFADPGARLILVIAFMLYSLGFIDLLGHTSGTPVLFGQYSIPFFILLLLYPLGFIILGALFFSKKSLDRLKDGIAWIQSSNIRGAGFLVGVLIIALMIFWDLDRWRNYPILRLNLLVLLIFAAAVVLLWGWRRSGRPETWRRAGLYTLIGFLAVEGLLQALGWSGNLPAFVSRIDSPFVSYGRVYNRGENLTNGLRNRNGLYYPEFRFEPEARRILVTGDTFVQALEVEPEQNLGVRLDQMLAADLSGTATEVFALGLPGYGTGVYLDVPLFPFTLDYFEPQEILILFNLGHDFKPLLEPSPEQPRYILNDAGQVRVHPESRGTTLHDTQHSVLHVYEPLQPVLVVKSHLMTPKVVRALVDRIAGRSTSQALAGNLADPAAPGANPIVFEKTPSDEQTRAYQLALGLLEPFNDFANYEGLKVRLVTIPAFPVSFFETYSGPDWPTEIGDYDLLLPERNLQAFAEAHDLAFLPMGRYMQSSGLPVEQVQELYFDGGSGALTPQGHAYFADAIYDCFYSPAGISLSQSAGLCTGN